MPELAPGFKWRGGLPIFGEMASDRAQRFLDSLPCGLDSHPTFLQKASVFRQFLELASGTDLRALPGPLVQRALDPPPVTAWLPEVHALATYLAIADLQGWTDQQLVARARDLNQKLLSGPLYRILMSVVSAAMLVRGAPDRWAAMHRGVTLSMQLDSPHTATMTLSFPKRLIPPVIAQCYCTAFQVAFDVARIEGAVVAVESCTEERAVFRCTWK